MKKLTVLFALISSLFILIYSCTKEDKMFSGAPGNTMRTTVTGIVLDENNLPQNNVAVTAYSKATTTNQYGVFVIENVNVNKERCIMQFSKSGFFNRTHAFIASANTVNYVRIVLISNAQTHGFSSSMGAAAMLADNSSILFAANSFADAAGNAYNGSVSLTLKHLSPDAANFGFMIPGGDLAGKDLNDGDVSLYTYGMLGVELKGSSGETLQLAAGSTATLTMSIAVSQQATAPATIPLWYFDETTSLWKEEGVATKIGNNYVGTVSHFSWWNCDDPGFPATVKGKVIDCNGNPVPNCYVTNNGWYTTMTNQNGIYQGQIPAGMAITLQVLASNNPWIILNSQLENVSALTAYQVFIVPDLVIDCPTRVSGTIQTCSGENTSAVVSISGPQFYSFIFTQNGNFLIPVTANIALTLNANNPSNYATLNISPITSGTFNAGNILLCNNVNSFPNNFTVTGGAVLNQTYYINTIQAAGEVGIDSSGAPATSISITGSAFPNFAISHLSVFITDTVPGTFSVGGIQIIMTESSNGYNMYSAFPLITLTQVGLPGGRIKGSYSSVFVPYINGVVSINVNISGEFDVPRVN